VPLERFADLCNAEFRRASQAEDNVFERRQRNCNKYSVVSIDTLDEPALASAKYGVTGLFLDGYALTRDPIHSLLQ
jgi:hypothetical protein